MLGARGADLSLSDQVSLLSSFSLTAAAQPGKRPCSLLLPLLLQHGGAESVLGLRGERREGERVLVPLDAVV